MRREQAEEPVAVDERRTKELCGSEQAGLRCMLPKDHEQEHVAYSGTTMLTWTSPPTL